MRELGIVRNYIGGKKVESSSKETLPIISPSTGKIVGSAQVASQQDIDLAVESAEKGFRKWSSMSGAQRGRVLTQAGRLVRERTNELAELEVLDTGKPISEARGCDLPSTAEALEYYGGVAATISGTHVDLGGSFAYTRREPWGICAGIGAWNYPLQIAAWKSAPALACGNSMVFKTSEMTPVTATRLAEIYSEAGLPDGVFNVIHGAGPVGQYLASHPKVRKVSLTGSVPTGKKVFENAASSLKAVTLELGGKSPLILFGDCSIDRAVNAALMANYYNQGEVCCNGTRVFVEESLYSAFLDQLRQRVAKIRIGDPLDPNTNFGALISRAHQQKVLQAIERGKAEGATLLCGGTVPEWPEDMKRLREGFFVMPTIFVDCKDSMNLTREEIFGPVMSILTFKTEEEVVARANDTSYGLAAGVFTQDIQRAHRVVSKLQAGICWINHYNLAPTEVPFGGFKSSGLGRENGLAAIEHYTQLKTVYVEMGEMQSSF